MMHWEVLLAVPISMALTYLVIAVILPAVGGWADRKNREWHAINDEPSAPVARDAERGER